LKAALPRGVAAMTLYKVCGSGLAGVQRAARAIAWGEAEGVIGGGQERMRLAHYVLPKGRKGLRMAHAQRLDTMIHDVLWDAFNDYHMGVTAENLAENYGITRAEQDALAAESQQRAVAAQEADKFAAEIVPVSIMDRRGNEIVVDKDEQPRAGTTAESLAKLRAVFKKEGTVTAGNASTL